MHSIAAEHYTSQPQCWYKAATSRQCCITISKQCSVVTVSVDPTDPNAILFTDEFGATTLTTRWGEPSLSICVHKKLGVCISRHTKPRKENLHGMCDVTYLKGMVHSTGYTPRPIPHSCTNQIETTVHGCEEA